MTIEINIEEIAGDVFNTVGPGETNYEWHLMDILEERYGIETLVTQEVERMRGNEQILAD